MVVHQQKSFFHTNSRYNSNSNSNSNSPETSVVNDQPILPSRRALCLSEQQEQQQQQQQQQISQSIVADRIPSESPEAMTSSRTAALSRYLAALDQPEGRNPTTEGVNSIEEAQQQPPMIVDTSFTGSSVTYEGHKVVAMPSLGGKSVREVANETEGKKVLHSHHQRSRSVGRAPVRARDIVQDVYDRMGVSREDLTARDTDKFQERYRTAAALTTGVGSPTREPQPQQQQQPRGRGRSSLEVTAPSPVREGRGRGRTATSENSNSETDGQRRARSLSRGRNVSGRWPPTREQAMKETPPKRPANQGPSGSIGDIGGVESQTGSGSATRLNFAMSPAITVNGGPSSPSRPPANISYTPSSPIMRSSNPQPQNHVARPSGYQVGTRQEDRTVTKTLSYDGIPIAWKKTPTTGIAANLATTKVENGSVEEEPSSNGAGTGSGSDGPQAPSVRDRISALSGSKSHRNFRSPSFPTQYAKRERPPKIDIYQEARKDEMVVSPVSDDLTAPEPSNIPPSPAAAAAADAAVELLVRKNQFGRNRQTAGNAAVTVKRDQWSAMKPPTEIGTTNNHYHQHQHENDEAGNAMIDGNSLAMSSVSHDEFKSPKQPPSWNATTTKYGNMHTGVNNHNSAKVVGGNDKQQPTINTDMMDNMVEERVQRKISELETRMEAQMLRLESRMEERMKARMDLLEAKMDKIGSMLSMIVTTGAGNGGMQMQRGHN